MHFRVLAVNQAGQSEPGDASEIVVCKPVLKPPSAPRDLKSSGTTKQSISLQWVRPDDDGGSKLKGYNLEMKELRRQTWQSVTAVCFESKLLDFDYERADSTIHHKT